MRKQEGFARVTGSMLAEIAEISRKEYQRANTRIEIVEDTLKKRQEKFDKLPWRKRIFKSRPCLSVIGGDHQHDLWCEWHDAHNDLRFFGKYRSLVARDKVYILLSDYAYFVRTYAHLSDSSLTEED